MSESSALVEQLRSYLVTLPPKTRARLVREIEMARLKGQSEPAHAFILQAVRDVMREEAEAAERTGSPQRLFCEPLEPFLVDEVGESKRRGFIHRGSLDHIWRWLVRDSDIAADLRAREREATEALLDGDEHKAAEMSRTMRAEAVPVIEAALAETAGDSRSRMKFSVQLGGGRVVEDLEDMLAILRQEDKLAKFAARLPDEIAVLDDELAASILRRLRDESKDIVYPLIVVFRRLYQPAGLLRLLTLYERTDDGKRLVKSRLAPCVDIVTAEMEIVLARLSRTVGRPNAYEAHVQAIRRFYELANGLGVAVDLDGVPEWRNLLAAQRRRASEILSSDVQGIPGAVRRALRPRRREGERRTPPSETAIQEAEYAVRTMMALKPYRSELAMNELLGNVISQVENYIEVVNGAILQDLRTATGPDRDIARAELEAAIRINAIVFGENYAALLRRSGEVASTRLAQFDEDDADDLAAPAA